MKYECILPCSVPRSLSLLFQCNHHEVSVSFQKCPPVCAHRQTRGDPLSRTYKNLCIFSSMFKLQHLQSALHVM